MAKKTLKFFDRLKLAGCWAVGLYAMAIFFAFGALISLLNADILLALQALILMALFTLVAWWLARKNQRHQ